MEFLNGSGLIVGKVRPQAEQRVDATGYDAYVRLSFPMHSELDKNKFNVLQKLFHKCPALNPLKFLPCPTGVAEEKIILRYL